jgi:hypothetical protein
VARAQNPRIRVVPSDRKSITLYIYVQRVKVMDVFCGIRGIFFNNFIFIFFAPSGKVFDRDDMKSAFRRELIALLY